jgi:formate-dependent nitrite reductase membrane component NrfD
MDKPISVSQMLLVLAVKALEILMLTGSLLRPIRFRLPILNYMYDSTPLMVRTPLINLL